MKIKKIIQSFNRLIFGKSAFVKADKRIFILVTFITILMGVIGNASNIILGMGFGLILITTIGVLVVIFFYFASRNSAHYENYLVPFFLLSILMLSIIWFSNGGFNGNTLLLSFVYFIAFFSILPRKQRIYAFIIYLIMNCILIYLQYKVPSLVKAYDNAEQRFVDLFVGSALYLFLAFSIQRIILNSYIFEQQRVKLRNEQLEYYNTKLSEINEELGKTVEKKNEAIESRDKVFSIISHDLRSPFQSILGISGILESDFEKLQEADKKEMIYQLNQSLTKQYNLLGELLVWGRIKKEDFKPVFRTRNIKQIIQNSILIFTPGLKLKNINIEINCNENAEAMFDEVLFSTLIRNLVSNAIKFSYKNSTIYIELSETEYEFQISVVDKGIGIEKENLSRLFDMEQGFTLKGTNGESGFGLGLSLCNDIVKKHNGKISVKSEKGNGTTFTIHLPKYTINQ